jgi:N-methylhydantoinase A
VVGAWRAASAAGFDQAIAFDMGGTSTDVALLDGEPTLSSQHEVGAIASGGGLPIRLPMVDLHTVGAGGGSIAWLDAGGALRVGPRSAGADPGPACYGKQDFATSGEPLATVTDAHVVLGHLPDGHPLGEGLTVQREPAVAAVTHLAERANLSPSATAEGILRIAEVHMARAVQRISLQRGHDPRKFTLVPFGGAGGLHACRLAEQLGMTRVRVPVHPGLLSAVGMLTAPMRYYATRSFHLEIPAGESELDLTWEFDRGRPPLPDPKNLRLDYTFHRHEVAFRYVGQSFEITFDLDQAAALGHGGNLVEAFHVLHEQQYGYANRDQAVELVLLRKWMDGPRPDAIAHPPTASPRQPFDLPSGRMIDRERLGVGTTLPGPLTVTEYSATTLVPDGWTLRVVPDGSLLLEKRDV